MNKNVGMGLVLLSILMAFSFGAAFGEKTMNATQTNESVTLTNATGNITNATTVTAALGNATEMTNATANPFGKTKGSNEA